MEKNTKLIVAVALIVLTCLIGYVVYRQLRQRGKIPDVINDITDPPTPPAPSDNVTISATNPQDVYVRDWNVFTSDPAGKYVGNNVWHANGRIERVMASGQSVVLSLARGTYWFIIGSNPEYGGYTGTITLSSGQTISFSGVNWNKSVSFTVP
jgi:hypothetical protein